MCGIMRPTTNDITSLECCDPTNDLSMFSLKDYESLHSKNIDCCLVDTWLVNGIIRRRWNSDSCCASFRWEGQQELLGTLNVYKNDRRLGTIKCI